MIFLLSRLPLISFAVVSILSLVSGAEKGFQHDDASSMVSKAADPYGLENAKCQRVTLQAHAVSQNVGEFGRVASEVKGILLTSSSLFSPHIQKVDDHYSVHSPQNQVLIGR